jgi:hypothetical protein
MEQLPAARSTPVRAASQTAAMMAHQAGIAADQDIRCDSFPAGMGVSL